MNMKKWIFLAVTLFISTNARGGQLVGDTTMDQYADQTNGNYQSMNLDYAGIRGPSAMLQEAWQDPLQNLGEGQTKPAYSKYYWSPDLVLPIRLREGMLTLINFPEWELIETIHSGDKNTVDGDITGPNTVVLRSGGAIGTDTNIIIFGRSGNRYVFYVRGEGYNTERLTNSIIDIDVTRSSGASGDRPSSSSGVLGSGGSRHVNATNFGGGNGNMIDATFTRRFLKEDWLKSIPMDPSKFKFDIEIYVPNPDDVVIAPERVWHDDIFTYIDLGEKALNMIQRPIVTLIVERVETPVGFRTKGPNNRLIIVEGIGDMVMRNGKRMVCLKMRRSDDEGLQYVTYADNSNDWDVGDKIPNLNQKTKDGASSNKNNDAASANGTSVYGSSDMAGGQSGVVNRGVIGNMYGNNAMSASDIDYSHMYKIDRSNGSNIQNPYPQYKFGDGFANVTGESLSIELGTDGNVKNLEGLWQDLSSRYSSLLGGYEPFYSVDTPADGQGKELFHLRVGPVNNLETGDSVCSQLGRSGVFCSVVRVQ